MGFIRGVAEFIVILILAPFALMIIGGVIHAVYFYVGPGKRRAEERARIQQEAKRLEDQRKAAHQRAEARARHLRSSQRMMDRRTPEKFNQELAKAISKSHVNQAVNLVGALPEPAERQSVEIIRTFDSLKRACASAAGPEDLGTLAKTVMGGVADLEIDFLEAVTWVFRIMKAHDTADYNRLSEGDQSKLMMHFDELEETLDRAEKWLAYIRSATSNLSVKRDAAVNSAWIDNYPPIGDPGPGRYLES